MKPDLMKRNFNTDYVSKQFTSILLLSIALMVVLRFENWSFWVGIAFTAILVHFVKKLAVRRLAIDERNIRKSISGKEE